VTKLSFAKKKKEFRNELAPWKILIVDDEDSVHNITKLALKHYNINNKPLAFVSAFSAKEAINKIEEHPDTALILLDVVMEEDDAGLKVVDFIRNDLNNPLVRIILRTGQPGQAPENFVIDNFDINDYKEKTELTQEKLYTSVRLALKTYANLVKLENQNKALEYIVQAAPNIFKITTLEQFFRSVFHAAVDLLNISEELRSSDSIEGFIAYPVDDEGQYKVCIGTGRFQQWQQPSELIKKNIQRIEGCIATEHASLKIAPGTFAIPIKDRNQLVAVIWIDSKIDISPYGQSLLNILAMHSSIAFRNIDLYELLAKEHLETINMLAVASEYKDEDTGKHVLRIKDLTSMIAKELGMGIKACQQLAEAAVLHDIGKLSIPDAILRKPAKLTVEEFELMKMHTINGAKILSGHSQFNDAAEIALSHHEHYNGKGYPLQLKETDIPLSGRIVALADVYDALSNARPYKKPWPQEKVLAYILSQRGQQFDPDVVDAFLRLYEKNALAQQAYYPHIPPSL